MLTERSGRVAAAAKLHRHVGRRRLVRDVFVTEAAQQRYAPLLAALDCPVHLVTERAAKALSDTVTPAGLVAVCDLPVIAVAVQISVPGNGGTLIRLADAMGAAGVLLAGHSVDPYNGKCLRASAGSIFSVPVAAAPDLREAVAAVREAGLQLLATTVDGEVRLDRAGELLAKPTAWLFGPESHGLPSAVAAAADHRVCIPMAGGAESLNVASAAAICLYQSARALELFTRP